MQSQKSSVLETEPGFHPSGKDYLGDCVAAWELSLKTKASRQFNSAVTVDADYLADHRVAGQVIYPAAGYSVAALATRQFFPSLDRKGLSLTLKNLRFRKTLPLSKHHSISLQLCYKPTRREFTIYSKNQTLPRSVTMHAFGEFGEAGLRSGQKVEELNEIKFRCQDAVDTDTFYRNLRQSGLDYGPFFQRISSIRLRRKNNEVLTKLNAHPSLLKSKDRWAQHITLLDAAFQSLGATLPIEDLGLFVPCQVETLRVLNDFDSDLWCYVRLTKFTSRLVSGDITLYNMAGQPLVEVIGLRCLKFRGAHDRASM
ncbi:MAG: polyketide synthase dehydratase domain-containing protein [Gammaproteobacteria bacterium]|nr:polyketide synthase dehydratase domain-containing protein [Gammaproteobacteria bacterium]